MKQLYKQCLKLVLGILGAILFLGNEGRGGSRMSDDNSLVWVLWVPYGGKNNVGLGSSGGFVMPRDRSLAFRAQEKDVLGVSAVLTRETGIEFAVEDELAMFQFTTVLNDSPDAETNSVVDALRKITTRIDYMRKTSPYTKRGTQARPRATCLRYGLRSNVSGSIPGDCTKPILAFCLSDFQVDSWIRDRATMENVGGADTDVRALAIRLFEYHGYHLRDCDVDRGLQALWIQMRSDQAALLLKIGFGTL